MKCNIKKYQNIVKDRITTARAKELPVLVAEVFGRWEKGESPESLEKLCGISYRQLLERLKAYDPDRYKKIAERRGLGSIRAKQYGVRSLFELSVKRTLEKHGIQSKETILRLGNHRYRPDFPLFEQNTIIEAMGLNTESYWKRNARKTRDYVHYNYEAIAVVPDELLYNNARKCLNKKVRILRYKEFENFVATFLKKAPNKITLLNEKARVQSRTPT